MSLDELLSMLVKDAGILKEFVVALFSYVIGWFVLATALIRLAKWSDPRRSYGAASILVRSVVGTFFIQSATYLNMMALTVTGYGVSNTNAMSVMPSTGAGSGIPGQIFSAVLAWLATLGVIAMLHGAQLIIKAGDGSSNTPTDSDPKWTGCIFIVSGAIGVNLWRFVGGLI